MSQNKIVEIKKTDKAVKAEKFSWGNCAIILCVLTLLFLDSGVVFRIVTGLVTPYLHNYGENTILVNAWGLANGHGLYRLSELNGLPVFAATYPPVLFLAVAAGIKIWGVTYVPGRIITGLSLAGCAVLIAGISRKRGASASASWIAALMFLATGPIFQWGRYLRVDIPAVFFELTAVYLLLGTQTRGEIISHNARKDFIRRVLFVAFAVLAGFTKQSDFGLVVGALVGSALGADSAGRRRVLKLFAAYIFSAVAVFILIEIITGGSFHKFVVGSFDKVIEWEIFVDRVTALIADPMNVAVFLIGGGAIVACADQRRWLLSFCLIPLLQCLLTLGYRGSGPNYFFESLAAFCVASSIFLDAVLRKPSSAHKKTPLLLCAVLIVCAIVSVQLRHLGMHTFTAIPKDCRKLAKDHPVVKMMRKKLPAESLVLTEFSDMPLFAGCVPVMSDPFIFKMMASAGKWNPEPVVAALKNKKIAFVFTGDDFDSPGSMQFFTPEIAQAVKENYKLVGRQNVALKFYIPNQ